MSEKRDVKLFIQDIFDAENHPNVEWRQIMAMRNVIAHEYWGVDEQVVWSAIRKNLPELKEIIMKIKDDLK